DGELVALAAHVLDENGQMQLTAAGDSHDIGLVRVLDAQGDVALQFPLQALAQLAAGHVLAFAAREWRGVDLEIHGQCRLVDADRRQAFGRFRITHRHTDVHLFDTGDRDDVAGRGLLDRGARQAGERQYLPDLGKTAILGTVAQGNLLSRADGAAPDPADADAADIRVVVERGDLQLQRLV